MVRNKLLLAGLVAGISAVTPAATPAAAQDVETRVGKLEGEMRAVQRRVFPGGGGQLVQPDIAPSALPAGPGPGTPATSPVADLTARVSELEGQMATLTGQIEQAQFRQRQSDDALAAYRRATDARLKALEGAPAPGGGFASGSPASEEPVAPIRAIPRGGALSSTPRDAPAVERPASGDAPEDAYLYGYRLWQAKRYGEAETQLKKVVADYPKHRRASYAQNLLGRAYLDEGKPSLASIAFYDNYKKMPDGERAPDSLFYLAQALVTLDKPADACKVYGELNDVYGAKIEASMKTGIARGRTTAKCK